MWLLFVAFVEFIIRYIIPFVSVVCLFFIAWDVAEIKKELQKKKDKEE